MSKQYKRFIVCEFHWCEYSNEFVASFDALDDAIRDGTERVSREFGRGELGFMVFDCDERRYVHDETERMR